MQVDYSVVLRRRYPNTVWTGSGATYPSIVFSKVPIPKAELDQLKPSVAHEVLLERATARMLAGYVASISAGFVSSALGTRHWYPGTLESQVDLIGSVLISEITTMPVPFACANVSTLKPVSVILLHTQAQMKQVIIDGALFKQAKFTKFATQKAALPSMSNAQLESVNFVP